MPRGKKPARRGNLSSRGNRHGFDTSFVPFAGSSSPRQNHRSFTLEEEARNTTRQQSSWNIDQRLRDTKVSFVSAGTFDPREVKDLEDVALGDNGAKDAQSALADMTLESPQQGLAISVEPQERAQDPSTRASPITDEKIPVFVVDTLGSQPINTGLPPPQTRPSSPTPSNSSEEVILFRGRDQHGRGISSDPKPCIVQTNTIDAKIKIVEDKIHHREELLQEVLYDSPRVRSQLEIQQPLTLNLERENLRFETPTRHGQSQRKHKRGAQFDNNEASLVDYIENMDKEGVSDRHDATFRLHGLSGIESEVYVEQEPEQLSGDLEQGISRQSRERWDSDDIRDFDDLSTSDDDTFDIKSILSKRESKGGVRYLVIWKYQSVDEARWVKGSTLTSPSALAHIESFEAEEKLIAEFKTAAEEDSSSADKDGNDASDDEEDDDLLQRKMDRMSDENFAKLLAKQEELGMGSDELLLFDDEEEDDYIGFPYKSARIPTTMARSKGRGSRRPKGELPVGAALADAYDGFDVMDLDRPSLKKKPKARRGKPVLDISDSELEATMEIAWDNDRLKKKERKQEREEFRAQGLLGNKNGKLDMKAKYKNGMGIYALKDEIKTFLMGTYTTLALPPMDKADRKIVHELASAFNLKSKSAGSGKTRYPILYRTNKTLVYAEGRYAAVEARLTRRFLPRMDAGNSKPRRSSRSGFNNAAVSYRDGDIVGGSAPELGVENKGRAMLEKMGWSTGTALGAINNKGILQPVSHVVKTTKAGLG